MRIFQTRLCSRTFAGNFASLVRHLRLRRSFWSPNNTCPILWLLVTFQIGLNVEKAEDMKQAKNTPEWRRRLTEYIQSQGRLVTRPRMAVAEVFFSMKGHPGIEMVISQVRKKYPGIGDATVYRTMRLLVEAGLAIPRDFGEGFTRYEAYDDDKNHNHLVCSGCGAIIEFVAPELDEILTKIALEHEFLVNQHRVEIFGLCKKCQELKADSDRKQATKYTKKR